MFRLPNDIDIHTHGTTCDGDAVVCIDPTDTEPNAAAYARHISVGIHPWNADRADRDALEAALTDQRVVAIGEVGFDRARGPEIDIQTEVFDYQARIASERDLPLVIHCARATDLVLAAHKRLRPKNQWIIHGFRGNATTARQLLDAGIDLSFGRHYNPEAYAVTPPDRRYFETD